MKAAVAVMLVLACLAAAPAALSEEKPDCTRKDLTTSEEAVCMNEGYLAADKELNEVYTQVIEQIRNTSKGSKSLAKWESSLREAQRTWVKFRDLDCGVVEFEWLGGSGLGYAKWLCYVTITQQRTAELRFRYSLPKD